MEDREKEERTRGEETPSSVPEDARPEAAQETEAGIYRERWIRVSADLDNLRKRLARDIENARRQEREKLLRDFLGVLDNLERALDLAGPQPNEWLEGVEATRRQLLDLLGRHGAAPFEALGTQFDPTRHEAVSVVHSQDRPDGEVVDVVQRGYLLDGDLLRAARVIVNRGKD